LKAPETIETERLLLRKPASDDVSDIFERYASDAEVTKYLAWPMHTLACRTVSDLLACRWPLAR
jgi:RimJ/RimL family protein N-acetyltransferase